MVLTRPELELKRRTPLAGGQPGTHEFVRTATVIVGFDDTCDFICNGLADDVEIQAAVVYVATLGGGEIFLLQETFIFTAEVVFSTNSISIRGTGRGTICHNDHISEACFLFQGLVGTHIIGCMISNLKLEADSDTGDAVTFRYVDKSIAENLWILNTDQPNLTFEEGVVTYYCSDISISDCFIDGCSQAAIETVDSIRIQIFNNTCVNSVLFNASTSHGIYIAGGSEDIIISGNQLLDNTGSGVYVYPAIVDENIVRISIINNNSTGNGEHGIDIATTGTADTHDVIIADNTVSDNTDDGIRAAVVIEGLIVDGNKCKDNPDHGILVLSGSYAVISNNYCEGSTAQNGITISGSTYCVIDGNHSMTNWNAGISITSSSDNCLISNNICMNNGQRGGIEGGIDIDDDECFVIGNYCTDDQGAKTQDYGINVSGSLNWIKNNYLLGNQTLPIRDTGSGNKYSTLPIQLIQGTTFVSTADEAWGWQINADTNFALGIGWLPLEVQQVVRIRVIGVGLAAPGAATYMRIQITGEGATFDEVFTTEPIDVVDHNNEEVNFAIDDVINWVFTATDDADIGQLLGGDRLQIKILHEGAAGDGIATDAIIDSIQVEVV